MDPNNSNYFSIISNGRRMLRELQSVRLQRGRCNVPCCLQQYILVVRDVRRLLLAVSTFLHRQLSTETDTGNQQVRRAEEEQINHSPASPSVNALSFLLGQLVFFCFFSVFLNCSRL